MAMKYPEVGMFTSAEQLKAYYKTLSDTQLNEWMVQTGVAHHPSESAPINRMRMLMAISSHFFPTNVVKAVPLYREESIEALVALMGSKGVQVPTVQNEALFRMKAIVALRAVN